MPRIVVALFDDVEELDWAGPWEVLASWARIWPDDNVEIFTVADNDEAVRCAKGVPAPSWTTGRRSLVMLSPGQPSDLSREEASKLLTEVRDAERRLEQLREALRALLDDAPRSEAEGLRSRASGPPSSERSAHRAPRPCRLTPATVRTAPAYE